MGEVKSMFVKSGKEPVLFPIGICTIPGSWAEGYMLKVKVVIFLQKTWCTYCIPGTRGISQLDLGRPSGFLSGPFVVGNIPQDTL